MSNADKSKMENATIWVMQPKSHKVGELFHRYPISAKEKYVTSGSLDVCAFITCDLFCSLMFLIFGSDVFETNVLASTYPGLYKYEYQVPLLYIYFACMC